MSRWILAVGVAVVAVGVAACSKSAAPAEKTRWVDLAPMPVELEAPAYAITSKHADTAILVSARACVLLVQAGDGPTIDEQRAAVVAAHPGATVGPIANDGFVYQYAGEDGVKVTSFRLRTRIGDTTYRCEPFTARPQVTCEEKACRSLRARGGP